MTGRKTGIRPSPDRLTMRAAKIVTVAIVAAFFSIVAYNNVVDFETNYEFVRHVMSMDTTFGSPDLMWRAIENPTLHRAAYWLIIAWEGSTAALCWLGVGALGRVWFAAPADFDRARAFALVGLLMGIVLYGFGFLVIASEWFAMWQSDTWNAQATAGMFTTIMIGALIFIGLRESSGPCRADGELP